MLDLFYMSTLTLFLTYVKQSLCKFDIVAYLLIKILQATKNYMPIAAPEIH